MEELKKRLLAAYPDEEKEIDGLIEELEEMDLFMDGLEDTDEWANDLIHLYEARKNDSQAS